MSEFKTIGLTLVLVDQDNGEELFDLPREIAESGFLIVTGRGRILKDRFGVKEYLSNEYLSSDAWPESPEEGSYNRSKPDPQLLQLFQLLKPSEDESLVDAVKDLIERNRIGGEFQDRVEELAAEVQELKAELRMASDGASKNYWIWQGDGEDYLESLTCPVLISASALLEMAKRLPDHPECDATDAAHPAWWRSHDHTFQVLCYKLDEILQGKDDGRGIASEPWETLRRKLLQLVKEGTSKDADGFYSFEQGAKDAQVAEFKLPSDQYCYYAGIGWM